MSAVDCKKPSQDLNQRLGVSGFRFTPQRQRVYDVLWEKRFIRAKQGIPEISMATVYNCLDALVKSGLARQVTLERGATRFCPNMEEHCHYYCDTCGEVFDVPFPTESANMPHPEGFKVDHYDIAVHGLCAECATKSTK